MELILALVVIVLIALVYEQYFNKDVDELDGSGKPVHGQSPLATKKPRSSSRNGRSYKSERQK